MDEAGEGATKPPAGARGRGPERSPGERAAAVRALRAVLGAHEARGPGGPAAPALMPGGVLPLGVAAVDAHLSGGLALGRLHEVAPAEEADMPAALGFAAALLARLAAARPGQGDMLLVTPDSGAHLDGHGLAAHGLAPDRLLVLRVGTPRAGFWALEEGLRSGALTALVGVVDAGLDLARSRRLQLAAGTAGALLLVLRPAGPETPNAAATRWRIGTVAAWRDRFGGLARARWRVALARCRNGRPGHWLLEWDHAAHRLGLAGELGDHALPEAQPGRRRA